MRPTTWARQIVYVCLWTWFHTRRDDSGIIPRCPLISLFGKWFDAARTQADDALQHLKDKVASAEKQAEIRDLQERLAVLKEREGSLRHKR